MVKQTNPQELHINLSKETKNKTKASLLESMITLLFEENAISEDTYRAMQKESRNISVS